MSISNDSTLDSATVLLKLYVSRPDQKFLANRVRRVLHGLLEEKYLFITIDVRIVPKLAEMDNIVATPTLVKLDLERNTCDRLVGVWKNDHTLKRFLLGLHIEQAGHDEAADDI